MLREEECLTSREERERLTEAEDMSASAREYPKPKPQYVQRGGDGGAEDGDRR